MSDPELLEVTGRLEFVTNHAEYRHRERHRYAEETFARINTTHFGGRLLPTRFGFSPTHPRMVADYLRVNAYGGHGEMVFQPGFALGQNKEWVSKDFPHLGFCRVFDKLILKLSVRKACLELTELAGRVERESLVAVQTDECNRIGLALGILPVVTRRRASDDEDTPVVAHWPFVGDDLEEYLGAITPKFHSLLFGGRHSSAAAHAPAVSLYEYFLRLNLTGEHDRLRAIFEGQAERAERQRLHGFPRLARVEQGKTDVDGRTPLSEQNRRIDPAWLRWENHLVAGMTLLIAREKRYDELPVLADALEDAGCDNAFLLRHLRAEIQHTRGCWAVTRLVALARELTPTD